MTTKEAIDNIKVAIAEVEWDYPMDYAVAFDMAIEALEKADKYRWHDLRKDPNDLPKGYIEVCSQEIWGGKEYTMCSYGSWYWQNHNIIAWREIEPFEEDEE